LFASERVTMHLMMSTTGSACWVMIATASAMLD
jgi:hypothetical protein